MFKHPDSSPFSCRNLVQYDITLSYLTTKKSHMQPLPPLQQLHLYTQCRENFRPKLGVRCTGQSDDPSPDELKKGGYRDGNGQDIIRRVNSLGASIQIFTYNIHRPVRTMSAALYWQLFAYFCKQDMDLLKALKSAEVEHASNLDLYKKNLSVFSTLKQELISIRELLSTTEQKLAEATISLETQKEHVNQARSEQVAAEAFLQICGQELEGCTLDLKQEDDKANSIARELQELQEESNHLMKKTLSLQIQNKNEGSEHIVKIKENESNHLQRHADVLATLQIIMSLQELVPGKAFNPHFSPPETNE